MDICAGVRILGEKPGGVTERLVAVEFDRRLPPEFEMMRDSSLSGAPFAFLALFHDALDKIEVAGGGEADLAFGPNPLSGAPAQARAQGRTLRQRPQSQIQLSLLILHQRDLQTDVIGQFGELA